MLQRFYCVLSLWKSLKQVSLWFLLASLIETTNECLKDILRVHD